MQLSIIFTVFESQEALNRQCKHFSKMDLSRDIEFVFVDDGSVPELTLPPCELNIRLYQTKDYRKWTQGIARNFGVKMAHGKYVLCTDIDHILSYETIMWCYDFRGNMAIFPRELGLLLEDGTFTQDRSALMKYGLDPKRKTLAIKPHGNTYCMLKETFWEIGGIDEQFCGTGFHASHRRGEDAYFTRKWHHWADPQGIKCELGPTIYTFTNGQYNVNGETNPRGLFHTLSYLPKQ